MVRITITQRTNYQLTEIVGPALTIMDVTASMTERMEGSKKPATSCLFPKLQMKNIAGERGARTLSASIDHS